MGRKSVKVVDLKGQPLESRRDAVDRLCNEHGQALRVFLKARMGGDDDLEDIFQEVFVRLSKMEDLTSRMPHENTSNRSFMFAIANNLVLDLMRSRQVRHRYRQRQEEDAIETRELDERSPERSASAGQELDELKASLLKLKPQWRKAFILSRVLHKSYREIADEMGVTVKQVEWFLKNALNRLQRVLPVTRTPVTRNNGEK